MAMETDRTITAAEKSGGRICLLDILRGAALFGTLGTNIWLFAHLGYLAYLFSYDFDWRTSADHFLRQFVLFLAYGKFSGLLSILFGAGPELKSCQACTKGR